MQTSRWITLALAALAACSSGTTPPDTTTPDAGVTTDTVELGAVCQRLSAALCSEGVRCSCSGLTTEADCVARQQPLCERSFAGPIAGVTLGRLRFDGKAAASCVAAYTSAIADCADPNDTPYSVACGAMFVDAAAAGADCNALNKGLGCADGAGICGDDGKCTPLPPEGQSCLLSRCGGGAVCVAGKCASTSVLVPKPAGAPCAEKRECAKGLTCEESVCVEGAAAGGTCEENLTCGRGLICRMSNDRTCRPKALEGERCQGDECAAGLFCDYTAQVYPTCRKVAELGASCAGGVTCATGAACGASETCVALPTAGETCVSGQCATGAICGGSNQCVAPSAGGATCDRIDACVAGFVCDLTGGGAGTCVALAAEGGDCKGMDDLCAAGLFCDMSSSKCRAALSIGSACSSARGCEAGAECAWGAGPNGGGLCKKIEDTVDAPCGFTCGGGLRCINKPATCIPGVCGAL